MMAQCTGMPTVKCTVLNTNRYTHGACTSVINSYTEHSPVGTLVLLNRQTTGKLLKRSTFNSSSTLLQRPTPINLHTLEE